MTIVTTRKIDELGRIVLPIVLRNKLGVTGGDAIDICMNDEGDIVLKVATPKCAICKSAEKLEEINGQYLCEDCEKALLKKLEKR